MFCVTALLVILELEVRVLGHIWDLLRSIECRSGLEPGQIWFQMCPRESFYQGGLAEDGLFREIHLSKGCVNPSNSRFWALRMVKKGEVMARFQIRTGPNLACAHANTRPICMPGLGPNRFWRAQPPLVGYSLLRVAGLKPSDPQERVLG